MRRLVFEAATTRFRPTRLTYVLWSTRLEEASYRQVDYYVQGMRLLYLASDTQKIQSSNWPK